MSRAFLFGDWIRDFTMTPAAASQVLQRAREQAALAPATPARVAEACGALRRAFADGGRARAAFLQGEPERSYSSFVHGYIHLPVKGTRKQA